MRFYHNFYSPFFKYYNSALWNCPTLKGNIYVLIYVLIYTIIINKNERYLIKIFG